MNFFFSSVGFNVVFNVDKKQEREREGEEEEEKEAIFFLVFFYQLFSKDKFEQNERHYHTLLPVDQHLLLFDWDNNMDNH